jgi:subtilisin family serine protease
LLLAPDRAPYGGLLRPEVVGKPRGTQQNMTNHLRTFLGAAFALTAALAPAQLQPVAQDGPGQTQRARQLLEQMPDLPYSPDGVIVRFKAGATESDRAAARSSIGGQRLRSFSVVSGLELVSTPQGVNAALAALRANPAVLYAEPDYVVHTTATPNDPLYSNLWGMSNWNGLDIGAPAAWDITTGDPNFIIAVIDTGTQYDHPDLAANMWTNYGEVPGNNYDDDGNGYIDDVRGWNFYDHNNDPMDTHGHGTHTAGTLGAVGNNGIGVTGVNWRCKIMPLKFIGSGGGFESDALAAIQYAARMGARVSNNSWGSNMFMQGVYDAVNASRNSGHLFVAAAGNAGYSAELLPFYPACYNLDNVISVTAIDSSGNLCSFSNYGTTSVDIGAPGDGVWSTTTGNGFTSMAGTSMASPYVAGAAALLWGKNPGWSYGQVRDRLMSTALPVASLAGKTVTGGMVNVKRALQGTGSNSAPQVVISTPTNGNNSVSGSAYFSGYAIDPEDGNLTSRTVWTSDLQGYLGTGSDFWRSGLYAGSHRITASVTDNNNNTTSTSVTIYVQSQANVPNAPTMQSIGLSGRTITIRWADNSSNETSFEIQREQRASRFWKYPVTAGVVGWDVTSFSEAPGVGTFHYRVRAVNAAGASAWSSWIAIKVE